MFTVEAETGQVTLISAPYELIFETGQAVELPIYNQATYELPRTGGVGTAWYTLGGLLLVLTAVILLMYKRNDRREDYEFS